MACPICNLNSENPAVHSTSMAPAAHAAPRRRVVAGEAQGACGASARRPEPRDARMGPWGRGDAKGV